LVGGKTLGFADARDIRIGQDPMMENEIKRVIYTVSPLPEQPGDSKAPRNGKKETCFTRPSNPATVVEIVCGNDGSGGN
jgi:hypothetical protein